MRSVSRVFAGLMTVSALCLSTAGIAVAQAPTDATAVTAPTDATSTPKVAKARKPKKPVEKKPADSGPGDPSGRPNAVSRQDTKPQPPKP